MATQTRTMRTRSMPPEEEQEQVAALLDPSADTQDPEPSASHFRGFAAQGTAEEEEDIFNPSQRESYCPQTPRPIASAPPRPPAPRPSRRRGGNGGGGGGDDGDDSDNAVEDHSDDEPSLAQAIRMLADAAHQQQQ